MVHHVRCLVSGRAALRYRAEALPAEVGDQVFQYAVAAQDAGDKLITAWLWIPPDAERIPGVLIGGLTLMEQQFVVDPQIRQACRAEQLAIVYCYPAIDAVFDYKQKKSAERLQQALDDLAAASGYDELATAPWFPLATRSVRCSPATWSVSIRIDVSAHCSSRVVSRLCPAIPKPRWPACRFWSSRVNSKSLVPARAECCATEDREAAWKGMRKYPGLVPKMNDT